jgi:polyribonucleotide nucleotidyltransferase
MCRALSAIIPPEDQFPYSIRVESLITESHGSSSMASVCGGCIALMDAGVPVKKAVAGIAMGMLLGDKDVVSDENAVILSDISGTEDALGTMDFKVAGDRVGITTFQLDIKCEGLTIPTMKQALEQAKEGRLYILDKMEAVIDSPRTELHPSVPRIASFKIPEDCIGKVIGPGGKQIRAIIEDFQLTNMDVEEDGSIQVTSPYSEKLKAAEQFVMDLIGNKSASGKKSAEKTQYAGPEPEIGALYKGKITGIHQFGVFLEIIPGAEDGSYPGLEGLCHVSELHIERVRNCEAFVNSLGVTELEVKYLGKNDKGKYQLSRKAVLEERKGSKGRPSTVSSKERKSNIVEGDMSQDEIDVITSAIEGLDL